jgi:hypothetical protein
MVRGGRSPQDWDRDHGAAIAPSLRFALLPLGGTLEFFFAMYAPNGVVIAGHAVLLTSGMSW